MSLPAVGPLDPSSPISPAAFALAITDLPLDTLHSKAAEIRNSISHLRHSNEQMLPFAEEGDHDCQEAMFENLVVIGRMNERVELLRQEVERRGMRWSEGEVEDQRERAQVNGTHTNGDGTATVNTVVSGEVPAPRQAQSGRLTDEELRRQLEAQLGEDGDGEAGVHL